MRYYAILLICCMVFCGCDQLKGKQGDQGTPAVAYSKNYIGSSTTNPYDVILERSINTNTDIITVYIISASGVKSITPLTFGNYVHTWGIMSSNDIRLVTSGQNGTASPAFAFSDNTGIYVYMIVHKQFNSASACIAYKKSIGVLDTNPLNKLIYGSEAK